MWDPSVGENSRPGAKDVKENVRGGRASSPSRGENLNGGGIGRGVASSPAI